MTARLRSAEIKDLQVRTHHGDMQIAKTRAKQADVHRPLLAMKTVAMSLSNALRSYTFWLAGLLPEATEKISIVRTHRHLDLELTCRCADCQKERNVYPRTLQSEVLF